MSLLDDLDKAEKAATPGTWTGNTKVGLQFIGKTVAASGPVHHFDNSPEDWACKAANNDATLIRLMRDNIRALIDVAKAAQKALPHLSCQMYDCTSCDLKEALDKLESKNGQT